jgi:hypothetical protein
MLTSWQIYSGANPFAELSSSLALARRVLAGGRPPITKEMDGLKLTNMQWDSIVLAWDQAPSRRPVLSSGGEPMIYYWRPGTEMVYGMSRQPDLNAKFWCLSRIIRRTHHSHTFPGEFIELFSFIVCLGRVPIRGHEDALLRSIHDRARQARTCGLQLAVLQDISASTGTFLAVSPLTRACCRPGHCARACLLLTLCVCSSRFVQS